MKKTLLVVLCVLMTGVFLFANPRGQQGGQKRIVHLAPHMTNEFQVNLTGSIEKYAKAAGIQVSIQVCDADLATQISQMEQAIASKVDGISLNPVSSEGLGPVIKKAKAAGIPVVLIHEEIQESDMADVTAFSGVRFTGMGQAKMEQVIKDFPNGAQLAVVLGEVGQTAMIGINEGYAEALKGKEAKYPFVFTGEGHWNGEGALAVVGPWLNSGRQIDALVCNNDAMAIGAIQALTAAGKIGQIKIYGLDAAPQAIAEIKKGTMRASVSVDTDAEARVGIDLLVKAMNGQTVEKINLIPNVVVTNENVNQLFN
jgi:ribose transport system substrate-binding protein/inositol transport system substrate-binding protein